MKAAILVAGICGRMGWRVAELISEDSDLTVAGGIESDAHPRAGDSISVGGTDVSVGAGFTDAVPHADMLVDFTSPQGTMAGLHFCLERRIPLVTGTTGHSEDQMKTMREASGKIPVLFSPNMSKGITVLNRALPAILRSMGPDCEVEIVEKHHRAKKDAPSGTAKKLAETLSEASPLIHSVRAGDIVGEHTILFGLKGERIELKHVAESRDCFAHGTLLAIKFLLGKGPGWYTMDDVVGSVSP